VSLRGEATVGGFTAYHTPGHTAGHVAYHHPELGVALLGDLCTPREYGGCGPISAPNKTACEHNADAYRPTTASLRWTMTTESIDDFLEQGLQEMYYTEQQLVDALEQLADETENEAASEAFSEHRDETQQHVDRLEEVFEMMDTEPETKDEQVVDSLIDEHEQFSSENEGEVLDRYNMAVGQKTEHYEIAAYGNLASLAGKAGYDDAADVLEETLREEEEALEEVTAASEEFDQQEIAGD